MKRARWAVAGMVLVMGVQSLAASPGWSGTWKLNVSKSRIPGPSFRLSQTAEREYCHDDGTHSFNFRCNGKDYPTLPDRTISCTHRGRFVINTTTREKGRLLRTARWALSVDGSKLTITTKEPGSTKSNVAVFERTSGSGGFTGDWTRSKRLESRPKLVLHLKDAILRLGFGEPGQYVDARLDGSDAVIHGSKLPKGITLAITPAGANELLTTKKAYGRIVSQGVLRLSSDGRTLTEEHWSPEKPDQKAVLVYERQ